MKIIVDEMPKEQDCIFSEYYSSGYVCNLQGRCCEPSNCRILKPITEKNMEIMQALKKQIPKKLKIDYYCGSVSYECPNCEEDVENDAVDIFNYCPFCGQAIRRE